jgi:hypothetical protein
MLPAAESVGNGSGPAPARHEYNAIKSLYSKSKEHMAAIREKLTKSKEATDLQATQRRRAFFTSAAEEKELAETLFSTGSWQRKVMSFLQSPRLQFLLTASLVFDVLIVVVELFMDAEFPGCNIIERDSISCCYANTTCSDYSGQLLAGGDYGQLCDAPYYDASYPAKCDPYKHTVVIKLHYVLFSITVAILSMYQVELILLFAVLRSHFVRNKLYVIDTVVVTAALSLEIIVKASKSSGSGGDVAGVLTFARCWRFVRLGHGLVSSVHEAHASHVEEVEQHVEGLMSHVNALQERLESLEQTALSRAGGKALKKFGKVRRNSLTDKLNQTASMMKALRGGRRREPSLQPATAGSPVANTGALYAAQHGPTVV